ncbi:unnamed protein product [Arabidopsis thaliana]|uniref:(thale cress) hypothetical protein n=1 Tax=Arabidopsis thaliana TaxID=3702 RepID=A0A7G2EQS1_ARATH|nr:unnamed protein product [Arabidopsis thaliana]
MGSFAGACEIVEEKDDEVRLPKHSGRYGKSVMGSSSKDLVERKQREYHGSLEYDIDMLFQSISVKPSTTRLMSSSFHHHETSASAGPSRTTSPSKRIASMKKPGTPQSPRFVGLSDSVSLKQALRDRCISKASEMAAQKRLSKSAAASPRVSEADRIKSLYNQVSNESTSSRSGLVPVDKGKGSLVEIPLMPVNDKPSSSKSVPQRFEDPSNPISEPSQAGTSFGLQGVGNQTREIKLLHRSNKPGSCLSSGSGDYEIELDENVASPSTHAFVEDDVIEIDKHVTSLPSHSSKKVNATELDKNISSSAVDSEQKGKLDDAPNSGTENGKTVRKVTRMIPRPKQPKKKILLKKKLKIGVVSATYSTKDDEEIVPSLDSSANQLLCQRCHCSLKSTSIDNNPPSYTSSHNPKICTDSLSSVSNKEAHQGSDENSSGSCNVSQSSEADIVIMKQDVSSSNNSGIGAMVEKETENPTSKAAADSPGGSNNRLELRFPSDEEHLTSKKLTSKPQLMVHPYCGGSLHCSTNSIAPSHCCCFSGSLLLFLLHCLLKVLEKHLRKRYYYRARRLRYDKWMSSLDWSKNNSGAAAVSGVNTNGKLPMEDNEEEEIWKVAVTRFQAREEEIERKKMTVKEKVQQRLGFAEEATRCLTQTLEELEIMGDPMRKEVGMVRKKIDMANRDIKSLAQSCQKKEKEYKDTLEAFNEKNKEKAHLVSMLMELLAESERLRIKKLEEINKTVGTLQ